MFKFNLLPEKPKEEIIREDGREDISLTLAFLPLTAVIISIGLIILNSIIFQGKVDLWKSSISKKQDQINNFANIITLNIGISQKTSLLKNPVQKDVEPQQFFDLSSKILSKLSFGTNIKTYGRDVDGSFNITLSSSNVDDSSEILRAFELNGKIKSVNLKSLNVIPESNRVETTVNFFIKNTKS